MGSVCRHAGLFDDALAAYRQAAILAKDQPVTRARLQLLRANAYERNSRFVVALRELAVGRKLLDSQHSDDARLWRVKLDVHGARIRLGQDRFDTALKQASQAINDARVLGDRQTLADALMAADNAELGLGRPATGRMLEALSIYQEIGDLSNEARVHNNLGYGAYLEGNWTEALRWFEGSRSASIRAGNVVDAAIASANVGDMLVKRGQLDEASPLLKDAVRVMRATGLSDTAAWTEIQMGRLLTTRGAHAEANDLLERVGGELRKLGKHLSALEAACAQAQALSFLGHGAEALRVLDSSVTAAGANATALGAQIAEARVQALVSAGRIQDARLAIRTGLRTARQAGAHFEEAMLLAARTELDRREGKGPDDADVATLRKIQTSLGIESMPRLAA